MTQQQVNSPDSGQKDWARPQQVRKDSNFRAWMFFLAGLFAVIALWAPLRALYERARFTPLVKGEWDAESFIVLAYGGVSSGRVRGPEDVSSKQFTDNISVLRERGYNPIGLKDVQAFYRDGKLLPRKAVLVTLEQSKRSSYLEAKPVLRLREFEWSGYLNETSAAMTAGDWVS